MTGGPQPSSELNLLLIPTLSRRAIRLASLAYGGIVFLWLRIEDDAIWPAAAFGAAAAVIAALAWASRTFGGQHLPGHYVAAGLALLGALSGLATAAIAALLMLLKNGLHAHLFPDFPFGVIVAVLQLSPVWALAGGLAGFGLALAWLALRR